MVTKPYDNTRGLRIKQFDRQIPLFQDLFYYALKMKNKFVIVCLIIVRGFVDYLLYGLPPESEERNYQARLDEPYLEYEKVALEYDSNGASELLSLVNAMTCENACVYMELGVQAGILLIADIVQNLRREEIENIHYRNKCELLIEDIRQVLEIMKDSMTDECKQNMTNILNKWGAERKGEE